MTDPTGDAIKANGTPAPVSHLRWVKNPFDAYQHFTNPDDGTPYQIEFGRGAWILTHGDRHLGNLSSLKDARQAAETDAKLAPPPTPREVGK